MRRRKNDASTMTTGQRAEGQQRQPRVEEEQHDDRAAEQQHVAEQRHDAVGDHGREGVDVVRQAGHEPADRIPVEERQRQMLEMREQAHPQVAHGRLADERDEQALHVPDESAADDDHQVERTQRDKAAQPFVRADLVVDRRRDRLVDDELGEDRRGNRCHGQHDAAGRPRPPPTGDRGRGSAAGGPSGAGRRPCRRCRPRPPSRWPGS